MSDEIISISKGKYKFSLRYLNDSADRIQIYCNEKAVASLDIFDDSYINKLFEKPADVEDVVDVLDNNSAEEQKDIVVKIALEKFIQWIKEGKLNNITSGDIDDSKRLYYDQHFL